MVNYHYFFCKERQRTYHTIRHVFVHLFNRLCQCSPLHFWVLWTEFRVIFDVVRFDKTAVKENICKKNANEITMLQLTSFSIRKTVHISCYLVLFSIRGVLPQPELAKMGNISSSPWLWDMKHNLFMPEFTRTFESNEICSTYQTNSLFRSSIVVLNDNFNSRNEFDHCLLLQTDRQWRLIEKHTPHLVYADYRTICSDYFRLSLTYRLLYHTLSFFPFLRLSYFCWRSPFVFIAVAFSLLLNMSQNLCMNSTDK